jgi:phospholipid/cholesterol/gamma-HCH transport system substrate-binding protein
MFKPMRAGDARIHPAWWALILIASIVTVVAVCTGMFFGSFNRFVPVTLSADRAGLIMDPGNDVRLRGVKIGKVADISSLDERGVSLKLDIDSAQLAYLPANVEADIKATTVFGTKYVDFVVPDQPSPQRLAAGAVVHARNVATEVNTVFESVMKLLNKIDPAKLNGILSALAEGLQGQGQTIGEATTAANQVLLQINPRTDTIRDDYRAFKKFSDAYGASAPDILKLLDAASTTSATLVDNRQQLDALLLGVSGFARSGTELLGPVKDNLVRALNVLPSTTSLLMKYNPQLTCMLTGGKQALDDGWTGVAGGADGKSAILDVALLFGDDPYKYPDNLPINGAKGGPGGKPSCGSLPDVSKNWPQRYLVTNTGWGTGLDVRPNPGIGFPGWANFFPTTRGVPKPPTLNRNDGGPAVGPIPYPGAPPYGAPEYAPDGTPLYPGLPPAPPPGAPKEPGTLPGEEPFVVPVPASVQPTPDGPVPPGPVTPAP